MLDPSRTTPPVNIDEVLAGLDTDTRAWMKTMLQASGRGLHERGHGAARGVPGGGADVPRRRDVSREINGRRTELARAVHNLRLLTSAIARDDKSVTRLLDGGSRTFAAFARESQALESAIGQLPGTLDAGSRALRAAEPLAEATGPALRSLTPAVRELPRTLRQTDPLLVKGRPALRSLGSLSRTAAPVVRQLRAGAARRRGRHARPDDDLLGAAPAGQRARATCRAARTAATCSGPPGSPTT